MNVLSRHAVLFRGFSIFARQFRNSFNRFFAFEREKKFEIVYVNEVTSKNQWPNAKLGPIDAVNPKYPLPGSVGFPDLKSEGKGIRNQFAPAVQTLPQTKEEKYASLLMEAYNSMELNFPQATLLPSLSNDVECSIHMCPSLLQKDLAKLFPDKKFSSPITAITISQRTKTSDLWSEEAAKERENLAESFISSAIEICAILKELCYWSDFIDPFTGQPYLGSHGEATLTETDENMTHFGFELDNAMCCKILRHCKWKHNVFVGLIFTDAPKDHPILLTN